MLEEKDAASVNHHSSPLCGAGCGLASPKFLSAVSNFERYYAVRLTAVQRESEKPSERKNISA